MPTTLEWTSISFQHLQEIGGREHGRRRADDHVLDVARVVAFGLPLRLEVGRHLGCGAQQGPGAVDLALDDELACFGQRRAPDLALVVVALLDAEIGPQPCERIAAEERDGCACGGEDNALQIVEDRFHQLVSTMMLSPSLIRTGLSDEIVISGPSGSGSGSGSGVGAVTMASLNFQ